MVEKFPQSEPEENTVEDIKTPEELGIDIREASAEQLEKGGELGYLLNPVR